MLKSKKFKLIIILLFLSKYKSNNSKKGISRISLSIKYSWDYNINIIMNNKYLEFINALLDVKHKYIIKGLNLASEVFKIN